MVWLAHQFTIHRPGWASAHIHLRPAEIGRCAIVSLLSEILSSGMLPSTTIKSAMWRTLRSMTDQMTTRRPASTPQWLTATPVCIEEFSLFGTKAGGEFDVCPVVGYHLAILSLLRSSQTENSARSPKLFRSAACSRSVNRPSPAFQPPRSFHKLNTRHLRVRGFLAVPRRCCVYRSPNWPGFPPLAGAPKGALFFVAQTCLCRSGGQCRRRSGGLCAPRSA